MYSLLALTSCAYAWAALRDLERQDRRSGLTVIGVGLALLLSHPYGAFCWLAVSGVMVLSAQRRKRTLGVLAVAPAMFLPFAVALLDRTVAFTKTGLSYPRQRRLVLLGVRENHLGPVAHPGALRSCRRRAEPPRAAKSCRADAPGTRFRAGDAWISRLAADAARAARSLPHRLTPRDHRSGRRRSDAVADRAAGTARRSCTRHRVLRRIDELRPHAASPRLTCRGEGRPCPVAGRRLRRHVPGLGQPGLALLRSRQGLPRAGTAPRRSSSAARVPPGGNRLGGESRRGTDADRESHGPRETQLQRRPAAVLAGALEARDALDVRRVREQVERPQARQRVAALGQDLRVAGQRRRVARDVDDAARASSATRRTAFGVMPARGGSSTTTSGAGSPSAIRSRGRLAASPHDELRCSRRRSRARSRARARSPPRRSRRRSRDAPRPRARARSSRCRSRGPTRSRRRSAPACSIASS